MEIQRHRKPRRLSGGQDGFTLIELLVVILIIGILAAIALPAFIGQRMKAEDGNAKSNVRNMMTQMEVCYTELQGYVGCMAALTSTRTGLPIGAGPRQVEVVSEAMNSYTLTAHSKSGTDFSIVNNLGDITHPCTAPGKGGCPDGGEW